MKHATIPHAYGLGDMNEKQVLGIFTLDFTALEQLLT